MGSGTHHRLMRGPGVPQTDGKMEWEGGVHSLEQAMPDPDITARCCSGEEKTPLCTHTAPRNKMLIDTSG